MKNVLIIIGFAVLFGWNYRLETRYQRLQHDRDWYPEWQTSVDYDFNCAFSKLGVLGTDHIGYFLMPGKNQGVDPCFNPNAGMPLKKPTD